MTYAQKLKDPRWLLFSTKVKRAANWQCQRCVHGKHLQAHHRIYQPDTDPWDYPLRDMECICRECHKDLEAALKKLRWAVIDLKTEDIWKVIRYAIRMKSERLPPLKSNTEES